MKRANVNRLLAVTLISSTFALMAAGCSTTNASSQAATGVQVKVIKLGNATNDSNLSGKIVVDEQVKVVSKVAGKVSAVNVKEGSVVKKGDLLVQLETDDFAKKANQAQAAVAAAQAQLADAQAGSRPEEIDQLNSAIDAAKATIDQTKAALDNAQINYDRTKSLFDAGASPQKDLDAASTQLQTAKAAYEQGQAALAGAQSKLNLAKAGARPDTLRALQAGLNGSQASLSLAQSTLQDAAIYSPMDGVVTEKLINLGEMASPGVPMLTVVNMNEVMLQVSVPQEKISQVKQGASIDVLVDGMDQKFKGAINFVSPVSDATNNTFPVKVKIDNTSGLLRAGMIAKISLDSMSQKGIEVPKSSIIEKDKKNYVYKLDGDVVHFIQVETQEKDKDWVYVKNGLSTKDQIVINPSSQLTDGAKVQVN
jgi:HlyD family secretion protein